MERETMVKRNVRREKRYEESERGGWRLESERCKEKRKSDGVKSEELKEGVWDKGLREGEEKEWKSCAPKYDALTLKTTQGHRYTLNIV